MAREARGAIELMAGGGVDVDDIPMLAAAGVDAVHLSARARATGGGSGGPGGGEAGFDVTDARDRARRGRGSRRPDAVGRVRRRLSPTPRSVWVAHSGGPSPREWSRRSDFEAR